MGEILPSLCSPCNRNTTCEEFFKKRILTLVSVVSSHALKVAGLIPHQDMCPGFRLDPWWGHARGSQLMLHSHVDVSLFSLSVPLQINK